MSLHFLFAPVEYLDRAITHLFDGAPLPVALLLAALLGLRHATDPDHLMAVTSLVAADGAGTRAAARLGAIWGIGHATTLLVAGVPLILLKSTVPDWIGSGAETLIGVVIAALAARVLVRWWRRDRAPHTHEHHRLRTPRQALAIGALHGLAGTGAVVLLLIAAMPDPVAACAALAAFAPLSAASMALCTSGFAWTLTRPAVQPFYNAFLLPLLGACGLVFGGLYAGLL
jgi:hypothetical protein